MSDPITTEQAVKLAESRFWENLDAHERAKFQLWARKLCMPFDVFHKAIEEALGRPVWTHEFGLNWDGLWLELMGEADQPSNLADILALIPEDKRVLVVRAELPREVEEGKP